MNRHFEKVDFDLVQVRTFDGIKLSGDATECTWGRQGVSKLKLERGAFVGWRQGGGREEVRK